MKALKITAILAISTAATQTTANPVGQDWQQQRLLQPTARQLDAEERGRVEIYDGLHEQVVDQAMDTQFPRIGSMMFVRTVHTDPDGTEYADDDCD